MRSLVYLLARSAKNSLLELRRKPGKLIMYLLVVALIVGVVLSTLFTPSKAENAWDLVWLKGIFFAFILLFFIIAIRKGLESGDVIFDMNDVNLLFVSPVNSRSILLYGVVRMMKMSFLAGFFILFQSATLHTGFGINFGGVLLIFAGFILAVSLLQIISLLIYSLTNGKPKRKLVVRVVAVVVFVPMIVYGLWQVIATNGNLMTSLSLLLNAPITAWTPVVGWATEGTLAFIAGDLSNGLLFYGVMVLAGGLLITYIALSNPDYYEDVLVASETAFEKTRAVAEGQVNTEAISGRNIKVARTGIKGLGATTLFHKHLRESFRANRLGLWGLSSLLLIVGAALLAIIANEEGIFLLLLQILMWAQIFLIGTGRGLKELYAHYIYLIPESSLAKIIWSNLEIIVKVLVESVLVFGIAGAILGESPFMIAMAIVVYTLFSLLLLGINYLSLRWTGADMSAGLLIMIYMLMVVIIMLPGLVPALVVGSIIEGWGVILGLGILAVWELLAAFGCFALSRGILHRCDLPVMKSRK